MDTVMYFAGGVLLAAIGGELFVRGVVGIAAWLRVPAGIIGATVAAFATSAPEFVVGMNAVAAGTPEVSVGNALGANVVNMGLVLGLVLLFGALPVDRRDLRRDLPFAVAAPALALLLLLDGRLSRVDGLVLVLVFLVWISISVQQVLRARDVAAELLGAPARPSAGIQVVSGLVVLVFAGRLIVLAADGVGDALGLDPFVVGATFVALGTCVPELATALIALYRGHGEVGVGTLIGSNIFNGLWIAGSVTALAPSSMALADVAPAVAASVVTTLLIIPGRVPVLGRVRGFVLLACYAVYVVVLLRLDTGGI